MKTPRIYIVLLCLVCFAVGWYGRPALSGVAYAAGVDSGLDPAQAVFVADIAAACPGKTAEQNAVMAAAKQYAETMMLPGTRPSQPQAWTVFQDSPTAWMVTIPFSRGNGSSIYNVSVIRQNDGRLVAMSHQR